MPNWKRTRSAERRRLKKQMLNTNHIDIKPKENYGYERKAKRKALVETLQIQQSTGKRTTRQVTVERWKASALVTRRGKKGAPNVRIEGTIQDKIVLDGNDPALSFEGRIQTTRSRSGKVSRKLVRTVKGKSKRYAHDKQPLVDTPSVTVTAFSDRFEAALRMGRVLRSLPGTTGKAKGKKGKGI